MADRGTLAIRLAVVDGGKVKAELKDVGDTGDRALRRIETAARPASRALLALDGAAGEVRGSLQGLAGRLGPVGTALTALGPAGLAAGAALAGVGLVLTRGLQEAAQADQSYRRLEAVLRATGQASGLTARRDHRLRRRPGAEHARHGRERPGRGRRPRHLPLGRRRHLHPCAHPGAGPLGRVRPGPQRLGDPARQGAGGAGPGHHRPAPGRRLVHRLAARADRVPGRDRADRPGAEGHPRRPGAAGRRCGCGRGGRAHRCHQPARGCLGQPAGGDRADAGGVGHGRGCAGPAVARAWRASPASSTSSRSRSGSSPPTAS